MKLRLLLSLSLLAWTSCAHENAPLIPIAPDYSNPVYWYEQTNTPVKEADIFYVYPILGTKPTDADLNILLYTNVDKKEERDAAAGNQRFNKQVYADHDFNFYSPFYRQITMDVYAQGKEYANRMQDIPATDIRSAFAYYMEHLNQGRPFILLGHSQGSALLIELLKQGMSDTQHKQMIAAYLIGYEITEEDLAAFPARLKPARGQFDTGVIISFNSVTDLSAKSPLLANTAVCINPVNWKTDGTPATRQEHKGIYKFDKQKGVYVLIPNYTSVRQREHYLICPDVSAQDVYQETLKGLFPLGCLHFMDSWLYSANLKENMRERADAYPSNP